MLWKRSWISPRTHLDFLKCLHKCTCHTNSTCWSSENRVEASCTWTIPDHKFNFLLINHSPRADLFWMLVLSSSVQRQHLSQSNIMKIQQLKEEHCKSSVNNQQNKTKPTNKQSQKASSSSEPFKSTGSHKQASPPLTFP